MREVISIHLGGAGVAIGATSWELFCLEHGISDCEDTWLFDDYVNPMFAPSEDRKRFTPRAIFVDSEPERIDDIRGRAISGLFKDSQLINGKEDSGGVYARGRLTVSPQLVDRTFEEIRRMTEECTELQGFYVMNSVAGGTGSALSEAILVRMQMEYPKVAKQTINVYPYDYQDVSVVEPYNTLLSTYSLLEHADVSFVLDNAALRNYSMTHARISHPQFADLNEIVGQVFSSLTASIRFDGALNVDMAEAYRNLVAYPQVHFVLQSFGPILSRSRAYYDLIKTQDISFKLFQPGYCMASCNLQTGKYLACILAYRGHVIPKDVGASVGTIKTMRTVNFVDWSPTGFKCGINYQPGAVLENGGLEAPMRSVTMLSNTTSIKTVFEQTFSRFQKVFAKKAFVHWFTREGFEEGDFAQAEGSVESLLKDYEEIEVDPSTDDSG